MRTTRYEAGCEQCSEYASQQPLLNQIDAVPSRSHRDRLHLILEGKLEEEEKANGMDESRQAVMMQLPERLL